MSNQVKSNEASANNSTAAITVGNVNAIDIQVIHNQEEKFVPIKPICEAIGVSFKGQHERIKNDPILGSVVKLSLTTGTDGKQYEMFCLPYRFVFGWLFRIDSRNVKEESKAAVLKYQMECYNALFDYFDLRHQYIEERQERIEEHRDIIQTLTAALIINKEQLKQARADLKGVREKDFDTWLEESRQMSLFDEKEVE